MSKTNPIGQSMAAVLTPENQRIREGQKEAATAKSVNSATRAAIAAPQKTSESGKMQDSLGNPMSPGYEMIWKKEKQGEPLTKEEERMRADPNYVPAKIPPKNFIHLQTGWEKLLIAQRKICEKARKLWVNLEAAPKYASLKRNKLLAEQKTGTASGFIVDVDAQEYMEEQAIREKEKQRDDEDAA